MSDWCSRWDLNPHTLGAYASETYVSTIPPPEHIQQTFTRCTCTPLRFATGVWLRCVVRYTDSHLRTSTIPPPEQVLESIEKRNRKSNYSTSFRSVSGALVLISFHTTYWNIPTKTCCPPEMIKRRIAPNMNRAPKSGDISLNTDVQSILSCPSRAVI